MPRKSKSKATPPTSPDASPRLRQRKRRASSGAGDAAHHGGDTEIPERAFVDEVGAPDPLPLEPPPFTLKELRAAIPAHCFEKSYVHSIWTLTWNSALVGSMFYLATYIDALEVSAWARVVAWAAWGWLQGALMTGLWVLAHECGHGGWTDSDTLNGVVGFVLHSALLVPFQAWRTTHRNHHSKTGSTEHDEVFAPPTRSMVSSGGPDEMLDDSPLVNGLQIIAMLTLGWPLYLTINSTGPDKYHHGGAKSHFTPGSQLFSPKERLDILLSDIGFFTALGIVVYACTQVGFGAVFKWYLHPYLWVNFWLVLITYLQHTDKYCPHFSGEEWTWLRGAVCTIDRKFGWFLDLVHHDIASYHVAHHLFSNMAHYHTKEATEAMMPILGEYYLSDDTPIMKALWRSWNGCKFVEDGPGVHYYKSQLDQ